MLEHIVSRFKHARSTAPELVELRAFLCNPECQALIDTIRAEQDKEKRNELKKQLPAVTVSGQFSERETSRLTKYNGLVCLDFDAADNDGMAPEQIKAIISEFDCVAYAGLSVSGQGIFAVIQTDNTEPGDHAKLCDFLRAALLPLGLTADPSCKDVTRLRFKSWDPSPYLPASCETFDAKRFTAMLKEMERAALRPTSFAEPSDKTRYKVEQYIAAIESGCADITDNYSDWLKIGFALASEFGSEGENYFHRISQFSPKYDYLGASKKYQELCKSGSGRVRVSSFFYIAKNNGIKL